MKRRSFFRMSVALVASYGLHDVARAQYAGLLGECTPQGNPIPNPPPTFWPPQPSTGIHNIGLMKYMGFSQDGLEQIARENNEAPLIVASGPSSPPMLDGWTVEHLYDEDILLWVKNNSTIKNITCADLQRRIQNRDQVFFNMEKIKYLPVSNWMNIQGFSLPDDKELQSKKLGERGYSKLLDLASESEDPLVIGMRGISFKGFRPISVEGLKPIESYAYPLRKPIFAYYQDKENARSFWEEKIVEQQMRERDADMEIYKLLQVEPGDVNWE